MTSYKVYNYNRAAEIAGRLLANSDYATEDMLSEDATSRDFAKAVAALAEALAKEFNSYMEKNDLTDTGDSGTPSPRSSRGSSSRSKGRSSSSRKPSGRKSSGGAKGKGKGLSAGQVKLVNMTIDRIEEAGHDYEPHTVEDIEAVYDFGERGQMISENRLYAFYDGDVDAYYDDPDNDGNPLPEGY